MEEDEGGLAVLLHSDQHSPLDEGLEGVAPGFHQFEGHQRGVPLSELLDDRQLLAFHGQTGGVLVFAVNFTALAQSLLFTLFLLNVSNGLMD